MTKNSTELKELCILAYKKQIEILIEKEGLKEDCLLIIQLRKELNEVYYSVYYSVLQCIVV